MIYAFANPAPSAGADAAAQAAGEVSPVMAMIVQFAPLILLVVVFYFFLIRPQRKKDKENKMMLESLKVGDEICTIGGIVGKIVRIKDEKIYVETGLKEDKSVVLMERWAVRNVIKPISAD